MDDSRITCLVAAKIIFRKLGESFNDLRKKFQAVYLEVGRWMG